MVRFRSITDIVPKIKAIWLILERKDVYAAIVTGFVGVSAFYLGNIDRWLESRTPVRICGTEDDFAGTKVAETDEQKAPDTERERYVGSKNSDKYHLESCTSAQAIKIENKVFFASKEEAERAGYSPAASCRDD